MESGSNNKNKTMKHKTKKYITMCVSGDFGEEHQEKYKDLFFRYKNRTLTEEDKKLISLVENAIYFKKQNTN